MRTIKTIFVLSISFLFLILIGCEREQISSGVRFNHPVESSRSANDLSENQIYSTLIAAEFPKDSKRLYVGNATTYGSVLPNSSLDDVRSALQALDDPEFKNDLIESFVLANQSPSIIDAGIEAPSGFEPILLGKAEDARRTDLLIRFSRVGFDRAKQTALVYFEYQAGPKSGKGEFIVLSKVGEDWVKRSTYQSWVS